MSALTAQLERPFTLYNINETNPNYLISIFGTDEQGKTIGNSTNPFGGILSPIPEEFTIETSSTWHALLDGILKTIAHTFVGGTNAGQAAIGAVQSVTGALGYSLTNQLATQLIWESTTPVTFNIPLKFDAQKDAFAEVTQPILQLLKLTLPSKNGTFNENSSAGSTANSYFPLVAPGPSLAFNKYDVSIAIGNMFIFPNIIITSVSATFHALSVEAGDFISADVNVGVSTSTILTKGDLDSIFKNRNGLRTARAASSPVIPI